MFGILIIAIVFGVGFAFGAGMFNVETISSWLGLVAELPTTDDIGIMIGSDSIKLKTIEEFFGAK